MSLNVSCTILIKQAFDKMQANKLNELRHQLLLANLKHRVYNTPKQGVK